MSSGGFHANVLACVCGRVRVMPPQGSFAGEAQSAAAASFYLSASDLKKPARHELAVCTDAPVSESRKLLVSTVAQPQ